MAETGQERLPEWLKVRLPGDTGEVTRVAGKLRKYGLKTVCTKARCPNLAECWACGTATFMVLGNDCTRNCRFCAISTADRPARPDPEEPDRVARAVTELGLTYAVITSVTRDDLADGGAGHFAESVRALKRRSAAIRIELLVPDFQGRRESLESIAEAGADIVGHNLETVPRLTELVRDRRASYRCSLDVLRWLSQQGVTTKTSLLLGLGESRDEIEETLGEASAAGVRHVAMGQYLAPSRDHVPVVRYWTPEDFAEFGRLATALGYRSVASGPLVRSSYRAHEVVGARLNDGSPTS